MTFAALQAPASIDIVVDGLGTLAPGWQDRTGISHADGWTTVPMRPDSAERFAPLLAQLIGVGVLRWETGSSCRVAYYQPDGNVLGPVDTADEPGTTAFAKTFAVRTQMQAKAVVVKERTRLFGEAAAPSADGTDRHRAFAGGLGVPYADPEAPAESNPSSPGMSAATVQTIAGPLQRRRRLEQVHRVAGYLTYAAALAAAASFFEPGWPVNIVVIAIALVVFGIQLWLARRVRTLRQQQQGGA